MRRAATAVAASAMVLLGASACQTTQQLSAKIGRSLSSQHTPAPATASLGAPNRDVHVLRSALISAAGQSAVALELINRTARTQVDFPVLIDVRDAKGTSIYRNDSQGIEPSIQQLALLGPHATAWWVDDQILASGVPSSVSAKLGAATAAAPAVLPALTTSGVSAGDSFPGPHVSATVRNRSSLAQPMLPVYAVAIKGARVVGAGRAVIPSLAPGASAAVAVSIVGVVDGAAVTLSIPPTATR